MAILGEISSREHYGLRLAARLGESFYSQKPVSLKDISHKENISLKYLEQLIIPMKKKGMVKSMRGREGGYLMELDPKSITVRDIVRMYNEKEHYLVSCLSKNNQNSCGMANSCTSKNVWARIQIELEKILETMRLSEIIEK